MNGEELLKIIKLGETSKVQFKRKFDNQEKVAAEMIAFANSKGGLLLLGVDDKTGEIVGLDYKEIQKTGNKIATIANELVKPLIHVYTEAIMLNTVSGEKNVLVVSVDDGIAKPYKNLDGTIWIKQGPDKRRLTDNSEIMRLFQESGILLADEMEVYGTSVDDIDERLFAAYFKKEFQRSYQDMGLTYEKALKAKRVMRNNRITLAGLLFFGVEPQIIKPAFTIKTVSYVGNESSGIHYRSKPADLKGTVPELFKQAMMFLTSNLRHIQQGQGFNSVGVLEISQIVLEEIVQNALMHRDYFKNAPVRIFIFDNRVEICSPGKLPENLTVEELGFGNPVIRNNQIVAFGIQTLPFSGLGTGLKRSLEIEPDIELINDEAGEQFIVRIPRRNLDTSDENLDSSSENLDSSDDANLDSSGRNLDSSDRNLDSSGENLDSSDDANLDSSGRNLDTSDRNLDSSGENLDTSDDANLDSSSRNLDTSDKNLDSSSPNNKEKKRLSRKDLDQFIIDISEDYLSIEELAMKIDKNIFYLKNEILPKLIKEGKLERLYPGIPNHPRQKYRAKQQ